MGVLIFHEQFVYALLFSYFATLLLCTLLLASTKHMFRLKTRRAVVSNIQGKHFLFEYETVRVSADLHTCGVSNQSDLATNRCARKRFSRLSNGRSLDCQTVCALSRRRFAQTLMHDPMRCGELP